MDSQKNAVTVAVHSNDIRESNLILRKLWDNLREAAPLGFQFMPFREKGDTTISVGISNYGEVFLHYKEKGKIDSITMLVSNDNDKKTFENAIRSADKDHASSSRYTIQARFNSQDIMFKEMAKHKIHFEGVKDDQGNNQFIVTFCVNAFGLADAKYIETQKINILRVLLSAYTNFAFDCPKVSIQQGETEIFDICWAGYDPNWIDYFFDPPGIEAAELLPDFFTLFHYYLEHDIYDDNMRLVLNAAQDYFASLLMRKRLLVDGRDCLPGVVDMINTMMISTLEPLSCIERGKLQNCPTCGNPMFKISEHIRTLCKTYLGDYLGTEIVNKGYRNRSSFLHEGNAFTNEIYSGEIVPQINPYAPHTMLWPVSILEMNYFDYVSYVFRRKVHDLLLSREQQVQQKEVR